MNNKIYLTLIFLIMLFALFYLFRKQKYKVELIDWNKEENLVIVILGQSNAANHVNVKYNNSNKFYIYNKNSIIVGKDPIISCSGKMGNIWTRVADNLLDHDEIGDLLIIDIAQAGTTVFDWNNLDKLKTKFNKMNFFLSEANISPDYIVWWQGESDNFNDTSQNDFSIELKKIIKKNQNCFDDARILIALCSYHPIKGISDKIRQEQNSLIDNEYVFKLVDTDRYLDKFRYDNLHFNESGAIKIASEISNKIIKLNGE